MIGKIRTRQSSLCAGAYELDLVICLWFAHRHTGQQLYQSPQREAPCFAIACPLPAANTQYVREGAMHDMVLLAHIREQHHLSLESYGRPRMTEELQELGVNVWHRLPDRRLQSNLPRGARRLPPS